MNRTLLEIKNLEVTYLAQLSTTTAVIWFESIKNMLFFDNFTIAVADRYVAVDKMNIKSKYLHIPNTK